MVLDFYLHKGRKNKCITQTTHSIAINYVPTKRLITTNYTILKLPKEAPLFLYGSLKCILIIPLKVMFVFIYL